MSAKKPTAAPVSAAASVVPSPAPGGKTMKPPRPAWELPSGENFPLLKDRAWEDFLQKIFMETWAYAV